MFDWNQVPKVCQYCYTPLHQENIIQTTDEGYRQLVPGLDAVRVFDVRLRCAGCHTIFVVRTTAS